MEQNKDQSGAAVRGEAVACKFCDGEGVIHTGIDEAPSRECRRCDGSGIAPVSARAADAPSEPSVPLDRDCELLTMAQVNSIRDTIKPGDGWGGDDWDFALANAVAANVKSRAADALDSQPTGSLDAEYVLDGYYRKNGKHLDKLRGHPNSCTLDSGWVAHYVRVEASSQPTDGGVRNG